MHIVVNLRQFSAGRIGGQETVVRQILAELEERPLENNQTVTILTPSSQIQTLRASAPRARFVAVAAEDEQAAETCLRETAYGLLICPLLVLEPLTPTAPSAVWIPDLLHKNYPEHFDAAQWNWRRRNYRASALHADLIFTGSEHAKSTIIEAFRLESAKIQVAPLAADPIFNEAADRAAAAEASALGLPAEFLYYPANFWPHKNHAGLLRALQRLADQGRPTALVLTGSPDSGWDRVERSVRELGLRDRVRMLGYRPRNVVAEIYRRARAIAFPSLFEGFGMPILEAFQSGTPVVASNRASCPEVAGDAAILVDPESPEALAEGLARALGDEGARSRMTARGRERARAFTWARTRDAVRVGLLAAAQLPRPRRFEIAQSASVEIVRLPHSASAHAWNQAAQRSEKELLAFSAEGERHLPGAIEIAARAAAEAPGAGVLFGGCEFVRGAPSAGFVETRRVVRPAAFVRREAWQAVGGFDESLQFAFEEDLWRRLAEQFPFQRIERTLAQAPYPDPRRARRAGYEGLVAAKRRLGYAAYEHALTYARSLVAPVLGSGRLGRWASAGVALLTGWCANPEQMGRYFLEWRQNAFRPAKM